MGTVPPHDIGAEQVVLGAFLLGAPLDSAGPLTSLDFYRPAHQVIFEAIRDLDGAGKPYDPVMVADALVCRGQSGTTGAGPYLHTCMAACPAPAMARYYAAIVRQHAFRRRVIEIAARLDQAAADPGADLDAVIADAVRAIDSALSEWRQS